MEYIEYSLDRVYSLDQKTVVVSGIVLMTIVAVGSFSAYRFSDRYLHSKIKRDCLGNPYTLNKLCQWRRMDHEFLKSLRTEANFLAKWFKTKPEATFSEVKALAKRSFSEEDFFVYDFDECE